ncbi:MAG: TlpA disulfide reductase family protein [Sphingobacteriaceae bacterium]|nr:TlpA disulfide reductase family protein [Sphingobacteriaceae bacterium]
MKVKLLGLLMGLFVFSACKWGINIEGKYRLQEGDWRGALTTEGGELPFLFSLTRLTDSTFSLVLQDGDQLIETSEVEVIGDSLIARFPVFESTLIAGITSLGDSLHGRLIRVKYDEESTLDFIATRGGKYKFAAQVTRLPEDISGEWQTTLYKPTGDTTPALGVFSQRGNEISGTFRTPYGDYRYLTGILDGDSLYLSGFDGSGAYLVKANLNEDGSITGDLYAGFSRIRTFKSVRNPGFALPDPNSLTSLRNRDEVVTFSFPTPDGQEIGPQSPAYAGKVVVLQVLGTWCPNCLDETAFLADFHKKNRDRGFEVIGMGFERTKMPEKAFDNLRRLQQRFGAEYAMVLAGKPENEDVMAALPVMSKLVAFPTTLILDKTGRVRKVHTGFDGPATGAAYNAYVAEFTATIESLLAE